MDNNVNGLSKAERLNSKILIDNLFAGDSKSFSNFPFRVVFKPIESDDNFHTTSILISVSKKRFKRAVKRNLIKRQIREAYRTNKHLLLNNLKNKNFHYNIAFIYLSNKILDYNCIEKKIIECIEKINKVTD